MDGFEVIAIAWDNIRVGELEAMFKCKTNGVREATEVKSALLLLRDDVLIDEVVADGDEGAVVTSEILSRHFGVTPCSCEKELEIVEGPATTGLEMGVTGSDLLPKRLEGRETTLKCWQGTPGLTLSSCITTGPTNPILVRSSCTSSKLIDILEEGLETKVIGGEPRSISIECQRPGDNRSHDSGIGMRVERVVRRMHKVSRCW